MENVHILPWFLIHVNYEGIIVPLFFLNHLRIHSKKRATEPSVVVLCGPHLQGAQGVSCARHLTHHGCTVTLFVPNFVKMLEELKQEIDLFDVTDGVKLQSYKGNLFMQSICPYKTTCMWRMICLCYPNLDFIQVWLFVYEEEIPNRGKLSDA